MKNIQENDTESILTSLPDDDIKIVEPIIIKVEHANNYLARA